ncbi:CheA Signal Transduction Histidine Kinase [Teredinibacter turnerae T7901]|uniref:Chemotaxis protein CheA n=1 Tax=Teredinibacter turnerae (strain ATCC 39867 / T7901) TaxID=377629 RepID=C5BQ27_TERTT|nr:Hpt domain-containing protein [Teredinibacter turnerae]ACR10972.1 CheA Signal Transduction Histidine Kinase [Teredinibacter turnerae T7901]
MKIDPKTLAFLLESMRESVRDIKRLCRPGFGSSELLQMARIAHKLKGEATVVGLANLSLLVSQFEDYLQCLRDRVAVSPSHRTTIERYLMRINAAANRIQKYVAPASEVMPLAKPSPVSKPEVSTSGFAATLQVLAANMGRSDNKSVALNLEKFNAQGIPRPLLVKIQDMVMQLVRNAIAHGIEQPAERMANGKPEQGRVAVVVRREADAVLVAVQDNGKGIDLEKIRRRLIFKYGVAVRKAADLTREQLINALYLPGFSTLTKMQNHAGRGVGLDLVKSYVRELGGRIDVEFEAGQYTRFVLRLPLANAPTGKVIRLPKGRQRPAREQPAQSRHG